MLNNRIVLAGLASAAGVGAALRNAGAKFVELDRRDSQRRAAAISLPTLGRRRSSTPKLKRPRTPHDHAMIAKAQAKRERKALKRVRDAIRCAEGIAYQKRAIAARVECRRIGAQVKAEALAVSRELEAEQLA